MASRLVIACSAIACVGARPAAPPPAPGLNHIYVVLDQATFDAVRASPGLSAILGRSDGGLPDYAPPPRDTDRIFFRGRSTYLELFAPKNRFDEPVGKVGIGIGADRPDTFERMASGWRTLCGAAFERTTVTWTRTASPVAWYDSIQCRDTATRDDVAVWAMIYRPEFVRWQRGASSPTTATDRRSVLAPRRAHGQGRFDITAITLSVPPALRDAIARQLESAGFTRRDTAGSTRLAGQDVAIVLHGGTATAAVSSMSFRIAGVAPRALTLGTTRLIPAANGTIELRFPRQLRSDQ